MSEDRESLEALVKAERVITNIVQYVDDEGRMAGDENGDDKWFSENGNEALVAIRAAIAKAEGRQETETDGDDYADRVERRSHL